MYCIIFKNGTPQIVTVGEAQTLKITPIYTGDYSKCIKYLK